jgi:hypothetical protein
MPRQLIDPYSPIFLSWHNEGTAPQLGGDAAQPSFSFSAACRANWA